MKFNYQARTKTGEIQSGIVDASGQEAATDLLRSHNLYVTVLEKVLPPFYARKIKLFEKISKKQIVNLSRQIAIMFKSEIPLIEAMDALAKQTDKPLLKEKILDMMEKIEGGMSLSKTFSFYPEVFSSFYVNMVKSGEASGKLSDVFSYLADYLEREHQFSEKIKGALIYPAFVSLIFFAVIGLMIFFVMPQITKLLAETGGEISGVTRFAISFSDFTRKWWWLLILLFFAAITPLFFYSKTKEGKVVFNRIWLKTPFINIFLKKIYLARLALNLSTLISGGVPIVQSLEITATVVGSEVYRSIVLETAEGVKRGEQISVLLSGHPKEITPLFVQMVVVGEKTGRMGFALTNIVDFYQKEVDRALENFMRILEPVLIVVFGLLIGGLISMIILPLYSSISSF